MGFELDVHPPGPGGLIQIAHEVRGMDLAGLAEALRAVHPVQVRATLRARPWSDYHIAWRRLAQSTSDATIDATLDSLTVERLAELENDPRPADPLTLAAIGAATDMPLAFFSRPNPPRPVTLVHFHERSELCDHCLTEAAYQCDHPVGAGTCDAWLCGEHAATQGDPGEDRHYCPAHARPARTRKRPKVG